jgi:hypothetical protein
MDAVVKYLDEATHKSSQDTDKYHLTWLRQHLDGVMLDEITRGMLNVQYRRRVKRMACPMQRLTVACK